MLFEGVVLAIGVYLCYKWLWQDPLSCMPGPKGWPLIGNNFQLDFAKPHVTLATWAKEYGPVYKVNLAGRQTVIVTGTDGLNEILIKKGLDFANRIKTFRSQIAMADDIFFGDYNDKLKRMKKIFMKGLKQHNLKHIEDITLKVVDDLVAQIRAPNGEAFEPSEFVFSTLFRILYVMMFSHNIDSSHPHLKLLRKANDNFVDGFGLAGSAPMLDFFPWLRFFGNQTYKKLIEGKKMFSEFFCSIQRQVQNGDIKGSWFNEVLEAHEEDPNFLTEQNVMDMLLDFVVAGSLTTMSTVLTFLNVLVHYPQVEKNILEEIYQTTEDKIQLSFSHRNRMPYTFACVFETLRYASVVSLGVPHETACSTSVGGFNIPKNTLIFTNLWAQHHDPDLFPNPMEFVPERFLDSDGKLLPADAAPRKHLFPFGAGVRVCAGETFAMTRLFIIFTRLVQHFSFLSATTLEQQTSIHPTDFQFGSTLFPKKYYLKMIPRN